MAAARAAHAEVVSSDEFVGMIQRAGEGAPRRVERELSKGEVDEWLKIFSDRRRKVG
jgi:hypothetical protein